MGRMIGSSSISFDKPPFIIEGASIVGRKEGDGPLGKLFDVVEHFGPRYSWTAQVEKLTQIKMLNYGVCGDCCDDIIYRMRQYALPEYVHHVIFLGGANDILQGRRIEDISRDYKRVLEWCEEKQYSLCVVLPFISTEQALNRQLLNLRQEAEHICGGKAFLLDLQPAIGMDAGARFKAYVDGIHPKSQTYEAMGSYAAPLIWKWLKNEKEA